MKHDDFVHVDAVQPRFEPKDDALSEARAAWAEQSAHAHREELADKYGADGIQAMEGWNARIKQAPGYAVREAQLAYQTMPKPAPVAEEPADADDYLAAARKAFRSESTKQSSHDRQRALAGIDRLANEHGNVGIIDTFGKWHSDLTADPVTNAPRVLGEIAQIANNAQLDQMAREQASKYEASNKISPDERAMMIGLLQNGYSQGMADAHQRSKHLLALDEPDTYKRAVISSQRLADLPAQAQAERELQAFQRAHPEVKQGGRVWNKMQRLLSNADKTGVRDLEHAYFKATQK